jgi:hypothetical protein
MKKNTLSVLSLSDTVGKTEQITVNLGNLAVGTGQFKY